MKEYNKIIRNKIPNILDKQINEYEIEFIDSKKTLEYLYLNLISTIYDGFENNSLNNIIDSIDLLIEIAKEYGFTEEEIKNQRLLINNELGSFSKKIILKSKF